MTKDELKAVNTVPTILMRYGIEVKRGRCKAVCHSGDHYTAKASTDIYYCFKCNKIMDIFDLVMHFNNCDFKTAFNILGGNEKPSFTAYVKSTQAKKKREKLLTNEKYKSALLKKTSTLITAYRNIINSEEPLSDIWCYCQNKLQYQIYILESLNEKR